MLADFGLTTIILNPDVSHATTTSDGMKGTVPWMAPELLYPEKFGSTYSKLTKASDVYALGMVILEVGDVLHRGFWFTKRPQVLTGAPPWTGLRPEAILYKVVNGDRPERPPNSHNIGLRDNVWNLLRECWLQSAVHRPQVSVVVKFLNEASSHWIPVMQEGLPASNGVYTRVFECHQL